ncbi:MAG TPA: FHA domain-containing protein [Anaeromyxobacteraceae bacterium]
MASTPCTRCGFRLEPGGRFCSSCGQPAGEAQRVQHGTASQPRKTPIPSSMGAVALPASAPAASAGPSAAEALKIVPIRHDGQASAPQPVGTGGIVCGRTAGELRFEQDLAVSPRHARFTTRPGGLEVEDLGSLNGTFVRVRSARPLVAGDEVRLGRQLLRLEPMPRRVDTGPTRPWGSVDPGHRVRLVQLLEGGGTGEIFPLRDGENAIGREVGQVAFPFDRYVSARHARLDVTARAVLLVDTGSSNGTFVRVTGPALLTAGDQVLIGMQLVRVE